MRKGIWRGPSGVHRCSLLALWAAAFLLPSLADAEDWPEWRGRGRIGVWNETGILEKFPEGGLKVNWRAPIAAGYAGPAVAAGRVYVTDFKRAEGNKGAESIHCLESGTGKPLWRKEWAADYTGLDYALGPRATPTVDAERVYVLGAMGRLACLRTTDGETIWERDCQKEFEAPLPTWGFACAPLVDGSQLICIVGAPKGGLVIAFDKMTGKELWRSMENPRGPGYSQPIIFDWAGSRRLMIWHPDALAALDPATGRVFWSEPLTVNFATPIATPIMEAGLVFVSSFFDGPLMMALGEKPEDAKIAWRAKSASENEPAELHGCNSTAMMREGTLYGIGAHGEMRAFEAKTGKMLWETDKILGEHARYGTAFLVQNGGRTFISNDRGELILAELRPEGYSEISRAELIKPTTQPVGRRERSGINWVHPAYAERCVFARNDEEIVCVSLKAGQD